MTDAMKLAVGAAATVCLLCLGACAESGDGDTGVQGAGVGQGQAGAWQTGGAGAAGSVGDPWTGGAGTGDLAGAGGFGDPAGTGGGAGFGTSGIGGIAGDSGGGSGIGGTAGMAAPGTCCADGDCICHGAAPTALTSAAGSYTSATYTISTGTVHYPSNGVPPFSAVAVCGGFTNTGPEMAAWGPFYASHGIVTVITTTLGTDSPDIRATKLLAAITELKAENTKSGSALFGKLSGRFGTSGYSMGGGGTTIASADDATLRTSVGLAAWSGVGAGVTVPTLLLCGTSDTTAACSMTEGAYSGIPNTTPKMMVAIQGATHFNWFGPTGAGGGTSGAYALAFQKVFLEDDERWKPLLLGKPTNGTQTTNIQ